MASDGFEVIAPPGRSKPLSVLVVEDDALVASYIGEVLQGSGYHIAGVAASAREALSLAAENHPALALVDIRLTGPIDGIELACLLRERFGVPAIFLSGEADPATVERARSARPLSFLAKPFLPSQVFKVIESVAPRLAGQQ